MRLIGTLDHELEARKFSAYLQRLGIESSIDPSFDATNQQFLYSIWIHNEDQIAEAMREFTTFQQNPADRQYNVPITEHIQTEQENPPSEAIEVPRSPPLRGTSFFLGLCILVYLFNVIQLISLSKEGIKEAPITSTQIALLYDIPPTLETALKTNDPKEIEAAEHTPFWRGAYTLFLLKVKGADTALAEGSLFIKIRQGEIWRLFSPAVLHSDLLHILFNMLWLWMLGRQVEKRIGLFRYVLLTLILGVITNTAQYLMSGPFFLGYSGIVLGLAGFIWYREKVAPWEGYPLQRSVIIFLSLFVLAMFAIQLGSFLLILFSNTSFNPNIANTAHIIGALSGVLLARLPYFSARRPLS